MGFNEGCIVFDNTNGIYFAGQTVHGQLVFDQDKLKKFRGIYVKMKGFCKVHWTSSHTRRIHGERQVQTEVHESNEIYYERKVYLVGAETGEHHINAGHHEFPFSCHLPDTCPASYKGSHGEIVYEFKVVVDRAFKADQQKKSTITVVAPLDLNADPYCREPLSFEFEKTYCCSCFATGACEAVVKLPVAGFVPGQTVPMEIGCENNSNVKIRSIKFTIVEMVTFVAANRPGTKHRTEGIYEIKRGPIPGNTTRNWAVGFKVPTINFYNVNNCKYINISYVGKVTMKVSDCHSDLDQSKRIVIGTKPLVGNQEAAQAQTQLLPPQVVLTQYQTPTNSTNNTYYPQPMINYPNPPFSNVNSPYPTISLYPTATSPYPNTNSPHPSANSPYSPSDPPYPVTNSPYPIGIQPFSASASPSLSRQFPYASESSLYPAANLPYPSTLNPPGPSPNPAYNSPNPTRDSPYPTTNSPYPTSNSPNPMRNSAYPVANPPYPTTPSPNLPYPVSPHHGNPDSTGNNVQRSGNGPAMPLLPIGAMPYPIKPNPYASASAPALDLPIADNDDTSDIQMNPPYNPEV